MPRDLISIVIPVKDADPYLERAIQNLAALEYPRLELVMVDDGSKVAIDQTQLAAALPAFERIEVLRHPSSRGAGPARNMGLDEARGEWVWFTDIDDTWDARILDILQRSAKEAAADVSVCGIALIPKPAYGAGYVEHVTQEARLSAADAMELVLQGTLFGHLPNKLFSRALLTSVGSAVFPPLRAFEDAVGFARLLHEQPRVVIVPYVLYNYHQNAGSLSRGPGQYTADLRAMGKAITDVARVLRPNDQLGPRLFMARCVDLVALHCIAYGIDTATSRQERRELQRRLRMSGLLWHCRWNEPQTALTVALSGWCFPAYRAVACLSPMLRMRWARWFRAQLARQAHRATEQSGSQ